MTAPVRRWWRELEPPSGTARADLVAGIPGAVASVPDGMASGVIIGVNPVFGLYASMVGPLVGGLTSSTRLMVVTTTTAAALATSSAVAHVDGAEREDAVFLLATIAGALMVVAGALRLGRYTRFVSHSVMIGFLTGVAANLVFGQLPDLLGIPASGSTSLGKAVDAVSQLDQMDAATAAISVIALVILVVLARTRIAVVGTLVALVVPSAVVVIAGLDTVALVGDGGAIPRGLPVPSLPSLSAFDLNVLSGAVAVAIIVLVQGTGVAESAPNPPGARASTDVDFRSQGFANVASGLCSGLPVGGSVGQTSLNRAAGARTRWASIYSAAWMAVILLIAAPLVSDVASATLAAILVYAAVTSVRVRQLHSILRTGWMSTIALLVTLVATLLLPVAAAVGLGVVLSLLLQLDREAVDLTVVERVERSDGTLVEEPAPGQLRSDSVTVLMVYGSLLFAGSRTLEARLPDPGGAERAVVVLRLRGRTTVGATFVKVLAEYARQLEAGGGRLYLSGVDQDVLSLVERTRLVGVDGPVRAFAATSRVGESTRHAEQEGEAWLIASRTTADELVDLVDDDDRALEVVTRAEMRARGATVRHRSCYVAVVTSDDELVVHRRADWKEVFGGYWDVCFGGVLGAGEAWADAARRELAEEAGVDADLVDIGRASWSAADTNLNARVYLARSDGPFTCPDGEVVEVATVPLDQLDDWLSGRDVCPDSVDIVLPLLRGGGINRPGRS